MIFGVVEVPDELHLRSAVEGHQVGLERLAVVAGVGPREALRPVVHVVIVAAVGNPEATALPVAGGGGRRRRL